MGYTVTDGGMGKAEQVCRWSVRWEKRQNRKDKSEKRKRKSKEKIEKSKEKREPDRVRLYSTYRRSRRVHNRIMVAKEKQRGKVHCRLLGIVDP